MPQKEFKGYAAYKSIKNPDKVIAECDRELEADSNNVRALIRRAIAREKKHYGDWMESHKGWQKSCADLEHAARLEPNNPDVYFHLGVIQSYPEKEKFLTKAIELDSSYFDAYLTRPGFRYGESSIRDYTLAIANAPDQESKAMAYAKRGSIYIGLEEYDKAISDLEEVLKLGSEIKWIYAELGYAWLKAGNKKKAIENYTKSIELYPDNFVFGRAYPLLDRGKIYFDLGQWEKAISDFSRFAKFDNETYSFRIDDAYKYRAKAYLKLGKFELALEDCESLVSRNAIDAYLLRGSVYYLQNRHVEAIEDFKMHLEEDYRPTREYYDGREISSDGKRKYGDAVKFYTKEIAENPNSSQPILKRGIVHFYQGEFDGAIDDLSEAIRLEPKSGKAYQFRAQSYFEIGKYAESVSDYSKLIELNRHNRQWHANKQWYVKRAQAYSSDSDFYSAIYDYQEAIGLDWQDSELYFERGKLYAKLKNNEKAISD
ncbi:MAG: tetratricopeptide repeat protein, partial [Candidatus Micrarchaeota archaeon]